MTALHAADVDNRERFVSTRREYNLVDRHEEATVLPLCEDRGQNLGVVPWPPLAGGFLAGTHERDVEPEEGRGRSITSKATPGRSTSSRPPRGSSGWRPRSPRCEPTRLGTCSVSRTPTSDLWGPQPVGQSFARADGRRETPATRS